MTSLPPAETPTKTLTIGTYKLEISETLHGLIVGAIAGLFVTVVVPIILGWLLHLAGIQLPLTTPTSTTLGFYFLNGAYPVATTFVLLFLARVLAPHITITTDR